MATHPTAHPTARHRPLSADATVHSDTDELELPPPPSKASGRPSTVDHDWGGVGAFGAGIVVGVLMGAGAALFLAPQTGKALRRRVRRGVNRLRDRSDDAFDALRDELRLAARSRRRALRRKMRKARYAAENAADDLRDKAEA